MNPNCTPETGLLREDAQEAAEMLNVTLAGVGAVMEATNLLVTRGSAREHAVAMARLELATSLLEEVLEFLHYEETNGVAG